MAPFSAMNLRPGYEQQSGSIQVPSQKLESLTLNSPGYKSNEPHLPSAPSPVRFREKVLIHAHRSYLELLTHLHQNKKSPHRSAGHKAPSRMIIFPKLPKSSSYSSSIFASHHSQTELDYPTIRSASLPANSHVSLHTTPHVQSRNNYNSRSYLDSYM